MGHLILDKNASAVDELVEFGFTPEGARQVIADWERGNNLRLRAALYEQEAVSRANYDSTHRGVDGVGQVTSRMSARLQHVIREMYGADALQDERFLQRFAERNNMCFKPSYQRKIMVNR